MDFLQEFHEQGHILAATELLFFNEEELPTLTNNSINRLPPVTISEFTKNRFVQWAPKGPFSSVTQKSTNCGNTLYNDLYKPPSN